MSPKLRILFFLFSTLLINAQTIPTDYLTGLASPRGLAFDASGVLFVSEAFSGNIFKVTAANTSSLFRNTGWRNNNITFDADGFLYSGDDFLGQIFKISPDGNTQSVYVNHANGVDNPWSLKFDADGNLFYSDQFGKIIKVTPEKVLSDFATGFLNCEGMAFDSQGNLYVADRNDRKLYKVDSNGLKTVLLSGLIDIRAVAVDVNDIVYFNTRTGFSTKRIIKYNPTTGAQEEIGDTESEDVNEMIFNTNGDLFIASETKVSVLENVVVLATDNFTIADKQFNIYPNPTQNNLHVSTNIVKYNIRNLIGKTILQGQNKNNTIDISFLKHGIYLLEMEDTRGKRATKKILKK